MARRWARRHAFLQPLQLMDLEPRERPMAHPSPYIANVAILDIAIRRCVNLPSRDLAIVAMTRCASCPIRDLPIVATDIRALGEQRRHSVQCPWGQGNPSRWIGQCVATKALQLAEGPYPRSHVSSYEPDLLPCS